jgi:hypothetical protein
MSCDPVDPWAFEMVGNQTYQMGLDNSVVTLMTSLFANHWAQDHRLFHDVTDKLVAPAC